MYSRKYSLDDVALVAEAEDEVVVPPCGVVAHDVPEDRLAADLDHRLRDAARLLAHPDAVAAAEEDDLHDCDPRRLENVSDRDRHDQLRAPLARVGELLRDLPREVPGQDHDRVGTRLGDPLRRLDRDVRSRREPPVLVGIPVDGVVEEVRADAAVVEQRVPLAGRAVADDLLAVTPEPDQQIEQRALRLLHVLGELRIPARIAEPLLVPPAPAAPRPRRDGSRPSDACAP